MPLSLRLIKELSLAGIECSQLHFVDTLSVAYSLRIDAANKYLEQKRSEQMQQRGIAAREKATASDFEAL